MGVIWKPRGRQSAPLTRQPGRDSGINLSHPLGKDVLWQLDISTGLVSAPDGRRARVTEYAPVYTNETFGRALSPGASASSYIRGPQPIITPSGADLFSVECLVYFNPSTAGTNHNVFGILNEFQIATGNGHGNWRIFMFGTSSTTTYANIGGPPATGVWLHTLFCRTGSNTFRWFVDGAELSFGYDTQAASDLVSSNGEPVFVGSYNGTDSIDGKVGLARIYKGDMSAYAAKMPSNPWALFAYARTSPAYYSVSGGGSSGGTGLFRTLPMKRPGLFKAWR